MRDTAVLQIWILDAYIRDKVSHTADLVTYSRAIRHWLILAFS